MIYQTNLATSYAAGRWQQLNDPDLVKLRPYWQYIHADGVMHPRPQHLAWHGLTLPREHAFWRTHFPPNGWGCHCRVRAVGQKEYDAAVAHGRGPDTAPSDDDNGYRSGLGLRARREPADTVVRTGREETAQSGSANRRSDDGSASADAAR